MNADYTFLHKIWDAGFVAGLTAAKRMVGVASYEAEKYGILDEQSRSEYFTDGTVKARIDKFLYGRKHRRYVGANRHTRRRRTSDGHGTRNSVRVTKNLL